MNRMKTAISAMVLSIIAASAYAVAPGKTVEWDVSMGKVTFDGKVHGEKGLKCVDCHSNIFKMKKGSAEMKMADINAGKFCGECHNGIKAFDVKKPENCSKCHKK